MNVAHNAPPFEWTVQPARQRPLATVLVLLVVVGAAWLVALTVGHLFAGIGAGLLLLAGLHGYFLRTTCRLDGDGVSQRNVLRQQRLRWIQIRCVCHGNHGVFFSWKDHPTSHSGLELLYGTRREAVEAWLAEHILSKSGDVSVANRSPKTTEALPCRG